MLTPSLPRPRRGRRGEEKKGQVPFYPGTEGRYKACSSDGPSWQAGSAAPAFSESAAVPKPRSWLPKGRPRELSQLPCGLPTTLFLLITSAIAERRTREERAGRLANPPAREGTEWGGSRAGGGGGGAAAAVVAAEAAAEAVQPRAT